MKFPKWRPIVVLLIVLIWIVGCSTPVPTRTPNTAETVIVAIAATQTAQPTATSTSTSTATLTSSPTQTSTPTLTPTETPRPTLTTVAKTTPTVTPEVIVTSTLDSGWTLYQLKTSKFAIALAPKWQPLDLDPATLDKGMSMVAEKNSFYENLFSSQAIRALLTSGLKFYAIDWSPDSVAAGYPTTLNILKTEMGAAVPFDSYVSLLLAQLKNIADPDAPISNHRLTISNLDAVEIKYGAKINTNLGNISARITQYVILDSKTQYVITFFCPRELADSYSPLFEKMAKTFELSK